LLTEGLELFDLYLTNQIKIHNYALGIFEEHFLCWLGLEIKAPNQAFFDP